MVRTHARSLQGTRASGTIPCSHWTRLTVLRALGTAGTLAAMSISASVLRPPPRVLGQQEPHLAWESERYRGMSLFTPFRDEKKVPQRPVVRCSWEPSSLESV